LANLLRDIACSGQINMARIGYAPLPPNLSQAIGDGIARLWGPGFPAEIYNGDTCPNPTFPIAVEAPAVR
jgi:phosphate transport system substrate-binding protein